MPTNLVRSVVDVASGDGVDFTLDVVPQTSDFVSNVTATLNFTLNGATTNVPFAFAGATSTNLDGNATAEIKAADLKAAMSDLTGIANRPFLTGDTVSYYATVNYFADNADTDESKLYENRYFPDNHQTVMVGDVEHWVAEGTDVNNYYHATPTNFTVTGPALSVATTPVTTATGVKFLVHGYSDDKITNITVNVGGVDYTLYGGDATNRVTKMFEIDSGLTADTEYAVTISGLKADGTALTPATTSFMTFTAKVEGVATNKVKFVVSGPMAGFEVSGAPAGWTKESETIWKGGEGPNSLFTATVTATNAAGAASVQTVTGHTKAAAATWKPSIEKNGNQVVVKAYADHTDDGNPADTEYAIGVLTNDVYAGIAQTNGAPVWKSLDDWQTAEILKVPSISLDATNTFFFVTRNADLLETRSDLSTNCWFDLAVGFEGTPAQATKPFSAGLAFGNVAITNIYFDPSYRQGATGVVEVAICKAGDTLPAVWTKIPESETEVSFTKDVTTITNSFVWDAYQWITEHFAGDRTNYTYRLRATVKAGNRVSDPAIMPEPSAPAAKLDFAPPVVTIDGTPADKSMTSNRVVSLTASVAAADQDGATYYWTFNDDAQPEGATLSKVSEKEGGNTAEVYAYDKFGNQSATVTRTWTLDTVAPTDFKVEGMPETTDPLTVTNRTEAFHLKASAQDATSGGVTYRWNTNGADVVGVYGANYDFNAIEGTNTVVAYALDAVSNQTAWVTNTWVVDTIAPTNLVITGLPSALTHETNLVLTATAMDATRLQFHWKLDDEDWVVSESFKKDPVADGSHTIRVYATDEAQNASETTNYTWTVDTTIPAMPEFTSGSPAMSSATNDTAYSFTVGEVTDVTTVTYHWQLTKNGALSGAEKIATAPDGLAFSGTIAGESEVAHSYTTMVWAVDAAMNVSTTNFWGWTYDTVKPVLDPEFGGEPKNNSFTNKPNYRLTMGSTKQVGITYYWALVTNNMQFAKAWTAGSSEFTGAVEADGVYTAMVYTVDCAGNVSTTNSMSWTYDKTPPKNLTLEGYQADGAYTNVTAYSYTATAQDATEITYHWTLTTNSVSFKEASGAELVEGKSVFAGDIAEGGTYPVSVSVYAVDAAQNVSKTNTWNWTYDKVTPATPARTEESYPADAAVTNSAAFAFEATTSKDGSDFHWALFNADGAVVTNDVCDLFEGTLEDDGVYTAKVYFVDRAGNVSATNEWSWTCDTHAPQNLSLEGYQTDGAYTNVTEYAYESQATDLTTVTYHWTLATNGVTAREVASAELVEDKSVFFGDIAEGGAYPVSVSVYATDAAQNVSVTNTWSWRYDKVTPATPARTAESYPADAAITNSAAFAFEATTSKDEGDFHWALFDADGAIVTNDVCDLFAGTLADDGVYTAKVYFVDRAGNVSATNEWSWTCDTKPPQMPDFKSGTPAQDSFTNVTDNAFEIYEITNDATTVTYHWLLTSDGDVTDQWSGTASKYLQFSGDMDEEQNKTHSCTTLVWAVDAAGNVSPTNTWGWTYDTVKPTKPAFDPAKCYPADGVVTNGTPTKMSYSLTAESEEKSGLTYYWALLKSDGKPQRIFSSISGAYAGVVSDEGVYTAMVYSVDRAGNISATNSWCMIYDRTPPTITAITGTPENNCETNIAEYVLSASSDDLHPGTNFWELVKDGASVRTQTLPATDEASTNFTGSVSAFGDGVYTAMVWSVDAARNVSTTNFWSWTYDTTPNETPAFAEKGNTPADGTATNGTWYSLSAASADAKEGTTYHWALVTNNLQFVRGWEVLSGRFENDVPAEGVYTALVYSVDRAGNVSGTNEWTWTHDKTAPQDLTLVGDPEDGVFTNVAQYAYAATASDATPITYFWTLATNGVTVASLTDAPRAGGVESAFAGNVPADGDYTVSVYAVDAARNVSATNTWSWTYDSKKPDEPQFDRTSCTPEEGSVAGEPTYSLAAASTEKTGLTYYWSLVGGAGTVYRDWESFPGRYEGTVTAEGIYTAQVYAVDRAGNVSATNRWGWIYDHSEPKNLTLAGDPKNGVITNAAHYAYTATATDATPITYHWLLAANGASVADRTDGPFASGVPSSFSGDVSADGDYTVSVYATDAAGNASVTNSWTWSFDATKPALPAFAKDCLPANGALTNGTWYSLAATADDKHGVDYRWALVDGSGKTVADWKAVVGRFAGNVPADGVYTALVCAVDVAGNVSATNALGWTVDTARPTVELASEAISAAERTHRVTATFSKKIRAFEASAVSVLNCVVDGGVSPAYPTNVFTFVVRQTGADKDDANVWFAENAVRDLAGNGNVKSEEVTVSRPMAKLTSNKPTYFRGGAETEARTVVLTVKFTKPVTALTMDSLAIVNKSKIYQNKQYTYVSPELKSGEYADTFTVTLCRTYESGKNTGEGKVTVQVKEGAVKDSAGNPNKASEVLLSFCDSTDPNQPTVSGEPKRDTWTGKKEFNLTAAATDPGEGTWGSGITNYVWTVNGTTVVTTETATVSGSVGVKEGANEVTVRAVDRAGNMSVASEVYRWVYAPEIVTVEVSFEGGVKFQTTVDPLTGETNGVEFTEVVFKPGEDCTFTMGGFFLTGSSLGNLQMWFVTSASLGEAPRHTKISESDATFNAEKNELTVKLPASATRDEKGDPLPRFFIHGIDNKEK